MVDIHIPLKSFKGIIENGDYSGIILESKKWVITTSGSLILIAKKENFKCIYPRGCENHFVKPSIPFTKIGYTGIVIQETEIAKEHKKLGGKKWKIEWQS